MREKTVIRILLLVARILASDQKLKDDIQHLANHISAYVPDVTGKIPSPATPVPGEKETAEAER